MARIDARLTPSEYLMLVRRRAGLTQGDVAGRANEIERTVTKYFIWRLEKGWVDFRHLDLEQLRAVAIGYGLDEGRLLEMVGRDGGE